LAWASTALRQSHQDTRRYHHEMIASLQKQYQRLQDRLDGLDHRVGHPLPFGLPRSTSWWTERRWRELDRCQNSGKHRTRFLSEKSLCRCRPVCAREEKVVHRGQTCTLSGVVKSSQLMVPQREVPVAPFHIGAGALGYLRECCRCVLEPVLQGERSFTQCPTGLNKRCPDAIRKLSKRLSLADCFGGRDTLKRRRRNQMRMHGV
jgi:hypothetical protein